MIPAVILAAGFGKRMGGPKAVQLWEGETLLHRATRLALAARCQPVLAVVGGWEPEPLGPLVQLVSNPQAAEGIASSIRAGVAALPPQAEAVLLLTVDQVRVDTTLLGRLLDLYHLDPTRPAACAYANTLGIPAVVPRRLFPALLALRGDQGAKGILLQQQANSLPFPGGSEDLDTPEDLAAFRR